MRLLDYDWKVNNVSEWHSLWFLGDQHLGANACAVGHLKETIQEIKQDPEDRVVLMGDCCDFINLSDPRFDIDALAPEFHSRLGDLVRAQCEAFCEIHEPIVPQVVGLLPGNHEKKIDKHYHNNPGDKIATDLNVPFLSEVSQARFRVSDKQRSYVVKGVLSHAYKGGTQLGAKITATGKILDFFGDHDFIAQAHMHEYGALPITTLDVMGEFGHPRIHHRERWMVLTGGYLKTYEEGAAGYGETKAYRPTKLGTPKLKFRFARTNKVDEKGRKWSVDKPEMKGE